MIFDENSVWSLFEENLKQAKQKLQEIEVFCGREAGFAGLSGWVFEQTIRHCIQIELATRGKKPEILEQESLGGRARADLAVGKVAVEVKTSGLFGLADVQRYEKYKKAAEAKGFQKYVYLTWEETFAPYRDGLNLALGLDNVFYLKNSGEWARFIDVLNKHV